MNRLPRGLFISASLVAAMSSGCSSALSVTPSDWDGGPVSPQTAQFHGDLGGTLGFSTASPDIEIDTGATSVRLDAVDAPSRWAMTSLTFNSSIMGPAWTPGTTATFNRSDSYDPTNGVYVLGCSGPTREDYDFDSSADRVTVHVDAGDSASERIVSFTASWNASVDVYNGMSVPAQTVAGSFVVRSE